MKKIRRFVTAIVLVVVMAVTLVGCREADRVSYNLSKQADNFNVTRRLTVFNMRTDRCIMTMTGKFSLQNEGNNELAVIVEIDRKNHVYQKHFVYLNEYTMYTVEDVTGASVSRYAYEVEFLPQAIVPVKITTDEIDQDVKDLYEKMWQDSEKGK